MPVPNLGKQITLLAFGLVIFMLPGCTNENMQPALAGKVEPVDRANDNQENQTLDPNIVADVTPVLPPPVVSDPIPVPVGPAIVPPPPPPPPIFPGSLIGIGGGGGFSHHEDRDVCHREEKKKHDHNYLLVWAADQGTDDGVQNPDFLAVIDADPESARFGDIVNTGPLPCLPDQNLINDLGLNATLGLPDDIPACTYNESHHMSDLWTDPDTGRTYVFAGGLISANVFKYEVTDPLSIPAASLHIRAANVQNFSVPDHMHFLPNGNLIISYMGSKGLTTPGGLVEASPTLPPSLGGFIAEYAAAQAGGPIRYQPANDAGGTLDTGFLAHPHGLSLNHHLELVIASDFVDPFSLATSVDPFATSDDPPKAVNFNFGTTVRLFDMNNLAAGPTKIIQVPNGPRVEDNSPFYNILQEPEGLMHVDFLNQPEHKGAFTASFTGGALFYCPDVTAANPVFINVFDFGPETGLGVFKITEDDNFLIMPVAGLLTPDNPLFDRDYPGEHARRTMVFDIRALLAGGSGPIACGPPAVINDPITGFTIKMLGNNNGAADCPKVVSNINVDSPLNFSTHGGPHMVETDPLGSQFVFNDYFVNLGSFNLPGSGSTGDLKVYLADIDKESGQSSLNDNFRDELTGEVGVDFNRPISYNWPNRGRTGSAKPHWSIFKRVVDCECSNH